MSKSPTPEQRLLLAHVDIGLQVKQFLASDVGRYLIGRAAEESDEAMAELKKVEPTNGKLIRELQNKIWRADTFAQWLTDSKLDGEHAEETLKQDEDNRDED